MFQTLANLQGVVIELLYEQGYKYKLANSSTWRSYVGINHADQRGEAKRKAQEWVNMKYKIKPTQDEADAIALGQYFTSQFGNEKKKANIVWGEDIL